MKIKSKIILPHIYLLTFKTQYELCMSFVRMQEFYESPSNKFRGKYFTLEEYMDYWSLEFGKGSFTYPSAWSGFNIPSSVFKEWRKVFFSDSSIIAGLRDREMAVVDEVDMLRSREKEMRIVGEEYYIIAVHDQNDEVDSTKDIIAHETAHALYSLYPEYKSRCKELLKSVPKKEIKADSRALLNMGYSKETLKDELQAYYSWKNDTINIRPEFVSNFREFKRKIKKGK